MRKGSTKEKIIYAALDLFSERGFDGVGVDQIAGAIGLKGPSIYRHFKGKDEILDTLLEVGEERYSKKFGTVGSDLEIPGSIEELKVMSFAQLEFTIKDEIVRKFRKMMSIEQFRNSRIASLATLHSISGLEQLYTRVFAEMVKRNIFVDISPELLAMEYVAPVTLMVQLCDRQPEKIDWAMERIEKHFNHFVSQYAV